MSLRQLRVRIEALPPDSPLAIAQQHAAAEAEKQQRSAELEDALTRYKPKG